MIKTSLCDFVVCFLKNYISQKLSKTHTEVAMCWSRIDIPEWYWKLAVMTFQSEKIKQLIAYEYIYAALQWRHMSAMVSQIMTAVLTGCELTKH